MTEKQSVDPEGRSIEIIQSKEQRGKTTEK